MPTNPYVVQIDPDEVFHVSVSAFIQSFKYFIDLYKPDGNGGFLAGQRIGRGDNTHTQWLGRGIDLDGSKVRIAVTHGGQTELSKYDIDVRLEVERDEDVFEDVGSWRIKPGLESGSYSSITLLFQ